MNPPNIPKHHFQGYWLWLEAIALTVIALVFGHSWLLPLAGILFILGALVSRGIIVAAAFAAITSLIWILPGTKTSQDAEISFAVIALLLGTASAFTGIIDGLNKRQSPLRGQHGKLATLLHFLTAGLLIVGSRFNYSTTDWLAWFFAISIPFLLVELIASGIVRLYTPRRYWTNLSPPGHFIFLRWALPKKRIDQAEDDPFTLSLPEMWMWPSVKRSLPTLLIVTLILLWLTTMFHQVGPSQLGVRNHLGKWDSDPLNPGLHLSLPWPAGAIQTIDCSKQHHLVLGFETDPGEPILWEKAHYSGEERSLVSAGDDFLSISVPIYYRIADPVAWITSTSNPHALIKHFADEVLLRFTLNRSAREIMTVDREALRLELKENVQSHLDQVNAGIEITFVYLRDIHPPVEVAPAFQEVVGAMEEKEAFIHQGEAYHFEKLAKAKGDSSYTITVATGSADERHKQVEGEISRFSTRAQAFDLDRKLYKIREGFEVFDEALFGVKKAVFDESLRAQIPTHLDLRKILNPDFVDNAPRSPETLIPKPTRRLDDFDLDIEGFLKRDQGLVPPVTISPENPDNLLNTNQSND